MRIEHKSPGPVAAAFKINRDPVEMIMGPVGSGKTSCALIKMVMLAQEQMPSTRDGKRKFRFCVVRDTYRQLWKTTIPSWNEWIPKTVGHWTGGDGDPATHKIPFHLKDGTTVELQAEFVAIGENKVEDVLRGYQVTAFYLNEADLLDYSVYLYCKMRAGRFPRMDEGGPTWDGIICDMNAPDTENWTYKAFVEEIEPGMVFFRQPSGFSPHAENIKNLPPGYYDKMAIGMPKWLQRRMIENEFGYSRDGKPVYEDWNDQFHVSPVEMEPVKGIPLTIGADAGLMPAAIIEQRMPNGQWRCLAEVVGQHMGPTRFGKLLAQVLKEKFEGFECVGYADPSAGYGTDKDPEAGEKTWIQIVTEHSGVRFRPAPTNKLIPRHEAVTLPLTRLIDGHLPGFIMNPSCKMLRKGFNSHYRFKRIRVVGQEKYSEDPEKNDWSHPHDGLQYGQSGGGEHNEVMKRQKSGRSPVHKQTHAITDENPQGKWSGHHGQATAITGD